MMKSILITLYLVFIVSSLELYADDSNEEIIKKGTNLESPTLLLLSGPTDNWHSDLGWWILGQHYLAQNYSTIAIERPGQGFAKAIENPSYVKFAKQLEDYISQQSESVVVVAFASSNISAQIALQDQAVRQKVKGLVLIDPDVLTEHALNHYTGESENYRQNWQQLEDYIKAGKYQERISKKIVEETQHLKSIIPDHLNKFMDWELYEKYNGIRKTDAYQLNKFKEITAYKADLEKAMQSAIPNSIPVVVLDSDFETTYLANIKDEKAKASIIQWRDEGKEQFFELAQKNKCSAYWPVNIQEHLLTFTHPELIELAVKRIEGCAKNLH